MPLLHLPLPSLISLDVQFEDPDLLQDCFKSFPTFSPNIRRLSICVQFHTGEIDHNHIYRWRSLQSVVCPDVALNVDALSHLSRMPEMTELSFGISSATLPDPITLSSSPPFFSNLQKLTLLSTSLDPISRLLSRIRLPVIRKFAAFIDTNPSKQDLCSFFVGVQTSGAGHTIESLCLGQTCHLTNISSSRVVALLGSEDLRPCMAFTSLRHVDLNIGWGVGLTDNELLALASAWPYLQDLAINQEWGWNTRSGITLRGLVQLLQICRSLSHVSLVLNTRGYSDLYHSLDSPELTLPCALFIDVLDSVIEEESVPAIGAFFAGIAQYCTGFILISWGAVAVVGPPDVEEYRHRWDAVCEQAEAAVYKRS